MHATCLLVVLFGAAAMGGPLKELRGLAHPHSHLEYHQNLARQGDDVSAEDVINEFESLGFVDPDSPGLTSSTPPAVPTPPPVVQANVPQQQSGPVMTVYVNAQGQRIPDPHQHQASPVSVAPVVHPSLPPQHVSPVSVAPVVQSSPPPPPVQPPPPSTTAPTASKSTGPSQSNPLPGMPSAPADFVEGLTSDDPVYKALVLLHHNIHRHNHSLPALVWNDTLFDIAKASAQSCVYEHTHPTPPYGQNIAAGNAPGNVSADITNGFYNGEIGLFHQAIGSFGNDSPDMADFEQWGHATQILWKDTTSVACYTAICSPAGQDPLTCGPQGTYLKNSNCGNGGVRAYNLACNYYPPGNYPDQYSAVPAPVGLIDFVEMTGNGVVGLPTGL